jgi:Lectin C-type domain
MLEFIRWEPGEPNNGNGSENCLALNVNSSSALLRDVDCGSKLRFICEEKQSNNLYGQTN